MAVKEIVKGEQPALRQKCEQVSEFDTHLIELLQDLEDTMRHHQGLGLAAPQIGVPLQVLVVNAGEGLVEIINPEIVRSEGQQVNVEGCLSFPGTTLKVVRPQSITVTGKDRTGSSIQLEAEGFLARVLCHEIDYLNGILFYDHVTEEDLLSQFLQQIGGFTGWETNETNITADNQAYSRELQLACDMLSDSLWKLELAIDLFKDHQHLLNKKQDLSKLIKIARKLEKEAPKWGG